MDVLLWLKHNHELATASMQNGIIPMVLIPLTAVTVALTSLAGIIAGWFGIKLKTEGPKQFLEVLLKKRVLISMVLFNLLGLGIYKAYVYVKYLPSFMMTINRHSEVEKLPSTVSYNNSLTRFHEYIGTINPVNFKSIVLQQETKAPKGAFRSGVISQDSIFYGTDDGYIYEYNREKLTQTRKFFIGTQVTTRPVIFQNRLYAGEGNHYTHHARIYSFDLATGKFLNAFQTKGHTEGQPYIGIYQNKELLFATAGNDGLYAIDPMTMKEVWHQNDGHLDATVTIEGNVVYTGTGVEKGSDRDRSYAIAYDFNTGKKIFKTELPLSNWMHPIITQTDVCYVLGEIYFPSQVGLFHCLNKKDGTPHFSIPFSAPLASKPFYIRDGNTEYAFFGDFKGNFCGVNITNKEKMWCYNTGTKDTDYALASVDYDAARGILWYPSMDNGLFGFEVKTGKVITHWLPNKNQSQWKENYGSVNIDGDTLFNMDADGNLRKFKID